MSQCGGNLFGCTGPEVTDTTGDGEGDLAFFGRSKGGIVSIIKLLDWLENDAKGDLKGRKEPFLSAFIVAKSVNTFSRSEIPVQRGDVQLSTFHHTIV
tara:strand:- start:78 stop:371 length:294 start_codon:yes stop_codon:yes gene_type:complete